ncbi:MAG: hypothetical protein ACI8RD_011399 [Bacillariaceae sp.]
MLWVLRITNTDDGVPTLLPWSVGWTRRTIKHVGIHLRLSETTYSIVHTTGLGFGTSNAIQSGIFKPNWNAGGNHSLKLHRDPMDRNITDLSVIMTGDLYNDETVVREEYIESSKTTQNIERMNCDWKAG